MASATPASTTSHRDGDIQEVDELTVLRQENERLKALFVVTEREEELITNQLLKRLQEKRKEKEMLMRQVEQEEEYLTNTLQQKLTQVLLEKVDMENQLEQEEEFISNKLQKQIQQLTNEKEELVKKLEICEENQDKMKTELKEFRDKSKRRDTDYNTCLKHNNRLKQQLEKLKTDNFVLTQRINSGQEKFNEIKQEKFLLEADMERQSECVFNTHSRSTKKRGRSISYNPAAIESIPSSAGASAAIPISGAIPIPGAMDRNNQMSTSPDMFDSFTCASPLKAMSFTRPGSFMSSPIPIGFFPSSSVQNNESRDSLINITSASPSTPTLATSFVDSFLNSSTHTRAQEASRSCLRRGWIKKQNMAGSNWVSCMFVVYDNGELMFCDSESGVTNCINLDTVTEIKDISRNACFFGSSSGGQYPNFAFELKTKIVSLYLCCENAKEHKEWMHLLSELSPMVGQ